MPCGIALSVHDKENKWYVYNGCSKHITGDQGMFLSLIEKHRGGNVTFGNKNPIRIKGKGVVNLDEKTKSQIVLYVEGLKHNLLSVSQMCEKCYHVTF